MMGNMASACSGRLSRVRPRSAHKAMSVPMTVVPVAVSTARYTVFQATPQRVCASRASRHGDDCDAISPDDGLPAMHEAADGIGTPEREIAVGLPHLLKSGKVEVRALLGKRLDVVAHLRRAAIADVLLPGRGDHTTQIACGDEDLGIRHSERVHEPLRGVTADDRDRLT